MFGNVVYLAEARAGGSTRQGHKKARDWCGQRPAERARPLQPTIGLQGLLGPPCHGQPNRTGEEGEHTAGR